MPAGLSWPRYITFLIAAGTTAMCGSQLVHNHYKPLHDLESLVEEELKKLRT
ncbi:protein brawnin [Leptopilina heterotoma]|uniref:protein brawnin n=1 Tax=Leptopilina heterotoma TaxID=63436 RepID=UPI001CA97FDF|nr:protein brawnin [Leptopilina heterotoma]